MSRIYLSPPDVRGEERRLILEAIDSNWIAPAGPALASFEKEVASVAGVSNAVGLSSGTAALHLALHVLGVGRGDEVVVPTLTFAASANAVVYTGATPIFIDADAETWTLSPNLVEEELAARAAANRLPKAAIVVDLYGQCADYERLVPLFDRYGIPVIEDAAEALGATAFGRPAGSYGRCGVLSFNGNKIITTSGGGMFLCDDAKLSDRVRYLSTQAREPVAHYEHIEIGFNYRLSNLLAAFGLGQLATLSDRINRRQEINCAYREAFCGCAGLEFMPIAPYGRPNFWLSCVTVDPLTGTSKESIRQHLESSDVEARPVWKPLHLQQVFAGAPGRIDGTAERLFDKGLCLPSGSGMSDAELDRVIEVVLEGLSARQGPRAAGAKVD